MMDVTDDGHMLDWGEASPEERKVFIMACAITAIIIVIGTIAAIILDY